MRERLIESWLDKANEKGYQPVFCQALAAKGFAVVHSTRHGPMEFGKDIVARAPDGEFHAHQLKGNPGSRLTIGQWNAEVLPQIHALMQQPVQPPLSANAVLAVPYLVTNGEVDEEVHAAIRGLNELARQSGRKELQLIARGELLGTYIGPIANDTWPQSIDVDRHILSCWALDGAGYLPAETFHDVILTALPFEATPRGAGPLMRAIFAGSIIHEICMRRYAEAQNHVSLLLGRAQFLASAYALVEKAGVHPADLADLQVVYWSAMGEDVVDLIADLEARKNRHFYDIDARLEFVYQKPRLFLISAVLSVAVIAAERNRNIFANPDSVREKAMALVSMIEPHFSHWLLGEYVVPQILMVYWRTCLTTGGSGIDLLPAAVLTVFLARNSSQDRNVHVASPYGLMPEVVREWADRLLGSERLRGRKQSYRNQLYSGMALFGLLVRRNMKRTAVSLFPEMTRFVHRSVIFETTWEYGLFRAKEAVDQGERLPFPAEWSDYVTRSCSSSQRAIPSSLAADLFTLCLFLILCPFRLNEEAVYHIDQTLQGNWHGL